MQKAKKMPQPKLTTIKVKLSPNLDPTSAKLQLDDNGEPLIKTIRNNSYQYYQLEIKNEQLGISKNGRYWNVIPSKSNSENNTFDWFADKFKWCVKNGGYNPNTATNVQAIVNKYIKFVDLKVFK